MSVRDLVDVEHPPPIRITDPPRLMRMEAARYHGDPCEFPSLSASIAKVLDKESPLHAWARHPRLGAGPRRESMAFDVGTLAHTMLLGEGKKIVIVDADDWKTKAARAERDAARASGAVAVLASTFETVSGCVPKLLERFRELGIVLDGESELAAFWTEQADNGALVQCRGMLDHLRSSRVTVYDLKSIESADLRTCQRHVENYGYDIQRAAYVSAIEKVYPHLAGRVDFVFVFFELPVIGRPVVTPVRLNGEGRALGERRWRRAVNTWEWCTRTDRWPAYVDGIVDLAPPEWALLDDERKDRRRLDEPPAEKRGQPPPLTISLPQTDEEGVF